jgi:hypothetical protein
MVAKAMPGFIGQIAGFNVFESQPRPGLGRQQVPDVRHQRRHLLRVADHEMETLRLQTTFANAVRGLLLHDTFVPAENSKRLVAVKAVRV